MDFTKEKIEVYKKTHGKIFEYTAVDGKSCILKSPTLQILDACKTVSGGSSIRFDNLLLENCWVDGDAELKSEDKYKLGIFEWLGGIIEKVDGELKEL